jgi:glycerol-3-phosphate dehydrogenase
MRLEDLPENWDLIIIGGGITGAGILSLASRMGLRVLLLERNDFAWGTSSRSSKLIHGGFRYLREGKISLTWASVKERERLLKEAPGLVEPLGFLLPVYRDRGLGRWPLETGFTLYDLIARKRDHRFYDPEAFSMRSPHVNRDMLVGGFKFSDAQVDDARLVLRLIKEAHLSGSRVQALNYVAVNQITRDVSGNVSGIDATDTETSVQRALSCRVVINATGSWVEALHPSPDPGFHIRPLRGSHLLFPLWKLPTILALSFFHPSDGRPIAAIPWEGGLLVGTTDIDYKEDLLVEPAITSKEVSYLLEGLKHEFPALDISAKDCLSSFAGIRPILSQRGKAPSEESREHVIWVSRGLVTVTGGKLTTFRRVALHALKAAGPFLPSGTPEPWKGPLFSPVPPTAGENCSLSPHAWRRLCGRYGDAANELVSKAAPEDLKTIPGTKTLWAELPFAGQYEQVHHLSDLMLRRVRIGLLSPSGATGHLDRIQELCAPVMSWDSARWKMEREAYHEHWKSKYAPLPIPSDLTRKTGFLR